MSRALVSGNAATNTTATTTASPCGGEFIVNSLRCFVVKDLHVCGMAGPTYKQNCDNYTLVIQRAYNIAKASLDVQVGPTNIGYALFDKHKADEFQVAAKQAGFGDTALIHTTDFTAPTVAQLRDFVNFSVAGPTKSGLVAHCSGGTGRTGLFLTALVGKQLFAFNDPFDSWMKNSLQFVRDNYNCDAGEFWDPAHLPSPYDGGTARKAQNTASEKERKMQEQKLSEFCLFWSTLVDGRNVSDCEGVDKPQLMRVLANEAIHCDAEQQLGMANASVTEAMAAFNSVSKDLSSQTWHQVGHDKVPHPLLQAGSLGKVIEDKDMKELAFRFGDVSTMMRWGRLPIFSATKLLLSEAHREYVAAVLKKFGTDVHLDTTPKDKVREAVDMTLREVRSLVSILETMQTALERLE
mmetsp:Transcript_2659/g.5274  ORF Transcript_2659/g.5274 Transcript_2659/m.5274 type:complete len:409 (-) Transcript_2659:147-1373(-)